MDPPQPGGAPALHNTTETGGEQALRAVELVHGRRAGHLHSRVRVPAREAAALHHIDGCDAQVTACATMMHHDQRCWSVRAAPDPHDIVWATIG